LADLVIDIARWRDLAGRDSAATLPPSALTELVLEDSGYTAMLQAERSVEAAGRLENLKELVRAMEEYETLGDFLEHVSLVMDNDAGTQDEAVTIMTIHAAKGLEFNHVFCAGWEDGVFPSQRAMDEGGLAERRGRTPPRLCRDHPRARKMHDHPRREPADLRAMDQSSIPSRFIDELPAEHIESRTDDDRRGIAVARQLVRTRRSLRPPRRRQRHARRPARPRLATRGDQRRLQSGPLACRRRANLQWAWAQKGRSDLAIGMRVFHEKFGYGLIEDIEGNKLEIEFEQAGRKRVMDSFVTVG
jgi:DNA helicase-2/ATP-dependent DNA helicase PcrA